MHLIWMMGGELKSEHAGDGGGHRIEQDFEQL